MATITIRRLDERTKAKLRVRAAHHGRSMEEEAREILRCALETERQNSVHMVERIHRRFRELGGVELELPKRTSAIREVHFEE